MFYSIYPLIRTLKPGYTINHPHENYPDSKGFYFHADEYSRNSGSYFEIFFNVILSISGAQFILLNKRMTFSPLFRWTFTT